MRNYHISLILFVERFLCIYPLLSNFIFFKEYGMLTFVFIELVIYHTT